LHLHKGEQLLKESVCKRQNCRRYQN